MSEKGGASNIEGWRQCQRKVAPVSEKGGASQRRVAPVTDKAGASNREGWRQ